MFLPPIGDKNILARYKVKSVEMVLLAESVLFNRPRCTRKNFDLNEDDL